MRKISVIIPVYNVEEYLGECLDSVLGCGYPELEVICINDGSTDGSGAVLEGYGREIRVISQENRGVSAARNVGLETASGDFVAFVDGDDRLHPGFFWDLMELQERYRADVVIGGYCADPWEDGRERIRHLSGMRMMGNRGAKSFVWGRIYRREILDTLRFREDMELGEDRAFNLDLAAKWPNMRVVLTNQKRYCYRQRRNSLVNQTTQASWVALGWKMVDICRESEGVGKVLALTESMKVALAARNAGMEGGEALVAACLEEQKRTNGLIWYRKAGYWILGKWKWLYAALLWIKKRRAKT